MAKKISDIEKFARWYATPLKVLKGIPDGDGAFVALSIGCFLCERYYRSVAGTQEKFWSSKEFIEAAAKDLDVSKSFFEDFWDMFRHGTQHQGAPKKKKKEDKTTGQKTHFRWRISHTFEAVPTRYKKKNRVVICINPWAFAELMLSKFFSDSARLSDVSNHMFGRVFKGPVKGKPKRVPWP